MKRKITKQLFIQASLLMVGMLMFSSSPAHGATISTRSLKMSNSTSGSSGVQYELSIVKSANSVIGSLQIQMCTNDPFPGTSCAAPAGLNFTSVSVVSQTGISGLTNSGVTTSNNLILTRTPSAVNSGTITINIGGIQNPSNMGTYYVRVQTFSSIDGTGAPDDQGGLAVAFTRKTGVTTEVPPFLIFCVAKELPGLSCSTGSSSFVNFGEFSSSSHTKATSQMIVATNAQYGLNISVTGNTLTSGNNIIPAMAANGPPNLNNSQFGINLRSNPSLGIGSDPAGPGIVTPTINYNQQNSFRFVSGDTIAHSSNSTNYSKLTVSYLVDVAKSQRPGVYNSTFIYLALASF